jgi:acetyl esterase
MGNYTNEDTTCTKIVEYTDFIVLNADYRLAPEDKFPAGVNDASAVLRWVKRSIEKYGGDPAQIFVSGESAGGNIAAAITAINYDPVYAGQSDQLQQLEGSIPFEQSERVDIKGLVLFYPCLEHGVYRDSHFRYSETFPLLTLKQMQHFWSLYLNDQHKDSQDYRACPLRTPKKILLQFPKTLIVLAKHDVLLDEGLEFARYLDELEVSVETIVYNNMVHGFFAKRGMSTEDQTIEICKKIKSMVTA